MRPFITVMTSTAAAAERPMTVSVDGERLPSASESLASTLIVSLMLTCAVTVSFTATGVWGVVVVVVGGGVMGGDVTGARSSARSTRGS